MKKKAKKRIIIDTILKEYNHLNQTNKTMLINALNKLTQDELVLINSKFKTETNNSILEFKHRKEVKMKRLEKMLIDDTISEIEKNNIKNEIEKIKNELAVLREE